MLTITGGGTVTHQINNIQNTKQEVTLEVIQPLVLLIDSFLWARTLGMERATKKTRHFNKSPLQGPSAEWKFSFRCCSACFGEQEIQICFRNHWHILHAFLDCLPARYVVHISIPLLSETDSRQKWYSSYIATSCFRSLNIPSHGFGLTSWYFLCRLPKPTENGKQSSEAKPLLFCRVSHTETQHFQQSTRSHMDSCDKL